MKKMPWKNMYFLLCLSLFGAMGFKHCINLAESSLSYTNGIASFLLFVCLLCALRHVTAHRDWERFKAFLNFCFAFLICFFGSLAAGVQLDQNHRVAFGSWLVYFSVLFCAAAASPLLAYGMYRLNSYGALRQSRPPAFSRRRTFLLLWGFLFLTYIPTFLASFPGFYVYDAEAETYMVFTSKYTTYQPLLHVLLLGGTIRLIYHFTQSYNAGIALYTLFQMAVLSACFAYMMSYLRHIGVKRWVYNLGLAFLALFPTVSMFVCCSTKDTLFSGGVVLLTTLLLEMAAEPERFWRSASKKLLFAASLLLILFFRNNGVYALAVFFVIFLIVYKKYWKRWLPVVCGTLLLFALTSLGLSAALHAKKGPLAEMLCVPIQQLARVYTEAGDELSDADAEILYDLIPQSILENYNPKLADMVKLNFLEDNFKREPVKYISLWFRLGIAHPDIYVNSFLENTYGYWYPDTVLDGYRGIWAGKRQYEDSSYFAFNTESPGERRHLLPALERFYEKISLDIYQQRVPVISMLFSAGFWHWVYAFLALYLAAVGYKKSLFSLTVIGLLYLTVLLGPIALIRYVLYMFFSVPLVLALLFDTEAVAGTRRNRI